MRYESTSYRDSTMLLSLFFNVYQISDIVSSFFFFALLDCQQIFITLFHYSSNKKIPKKYLLKVPYLTEVMIYQSSITSYTSY